jgi:hypothetical protein
VIDGASRGLDHYLWNRATHDGIAVIENFLLLSKVELHCRGLSLSPFAGDGVNKIPLLSETKAESCGVFAMVVPIGCQYCQVLWST